MTSPVFPLLVPVHRVPSHPAPPYLVPGHPRRILAFLIDELQRFLWVGPFLWLAGLGELLGKGMFYSFSVVILAFYLNWIFRAFCLYCAGATPGKYLMGLEVRSRDGGDLDFMQALVRILADDLGIFLLGLPRALLFFRLDRTQFSDWAGETRVVQRRGGVLPLHRSIGLGFALILVSLFFQLES